MSGLQTTLLLGIAFLGIFAESVLDFPRIWLGAQLNVLPPLIVCAAFGDSLPRLALVATFGGLASDALSGNPFGASVLPLYGVGFVLFQWRDLILRQIPYAQFVLGGLASVAVFALTLMVLLTVGERPLLGWATAWQAAVVGLAGAAFTPLCFALIEVLHAALAYKSVPVSPYTPDREIKRGRY